VLHPPPEKAEGGSPMYKNQVEVPAIGLLYNLRKHAGMDQPFKGGEKTQVLPFSQGIGRNRIARKKELKSFHVARD
jgi:hypothetical protein